MKITVTLPRPRNPLAGPARMRRGGSHRRSVGSARQRAAQFLRRELGASQHSP